MYLMIMEKYPRSERFLRDHPEWSIDEALSWTENELKKLEEAKKHT